MKERKTYWEKLTDPRWQRRRLEILQRDGFTCQFCASTDNQLQVHHKFYRKGVDPWDYSDNALTTLCDQCHDQVTALKERIGYIISHDVGFELFEAVKSIDETVEFQSRIYTLISLLRFIKKNPEVLDCSWRDLADKLCQPETDCAETDQDDQALVKIMENALNP